LIHFNLKFLCSDISNVLIFETKKASVCGRSLAKVERSKPAPGVNVCVFVFVVYRVGCVLYVWLIVCLGKS
jgi:hypothetical protein